MSLTFANYQKVAQETDQKPDLSDSDALVMSLLGLVGEAGTLLSEYKKLMRDGDAHRGFEEQVAEELGDILWYVANIATKCGQDLDEVAERNLAKTRRRWLATDSRSPLFDEDQRPEAQLPRHFEICIEPHPEKVGVVVMKLDGVPLGDPLTDNSYEDDGYRFHDVLHLAFAATLGWSPVLRKLMRVLNRLERRSPQQKDEVEDGGRSQVLEEAVTAAAYEYASRHKYLEVTRVDWELLRTIKRLTAHLEVKDRTEAEWERALLSAFSVWRAIRSNNGGRVRGDLLRRTLEFSPMDAQQTENAVATPLTERPAQEQP